MRYTVCLCLVSCPFYAIATYIPFLIYEILHLLVIIVIRMSADLRVLLKFVSQISIK